MMLIPQPVGLGHTETHKPPNYFINPARTPPSILTGNLSSAPGNITSETPQAAGTYPTGEGGLIPGRMQPELPGLGMYSGQAGSSALGSPVSYGSTPGSVGAAPGLMAPHYGTTGIDPTPYYPSLGPTYDMGSGGGEMWTGGYAQPPPGYYPYENTFGPQYPYDSRYCGMDINDGVRRKNATRESTNTLKAWLQEHKKNPYPTKGEKIMLAIITKMTLTQVSTWFANARRRLKKENKMTWIPKNRSNEAGSEKKDGDEEDEEDDDICSQTPDLDSKPDVSQSMDSDDSADRGEVTSTNNGDVTNPHTRDLASYAGANNENSKLDVEGGVQGNHQRAGDFSFPPPPPLSNNSETSHPSRYEGSEGSNPTIWSPVNDADPSSYRAPLEQSVMANAPYQHYQTTDHYSSSTRALPNHPMISPCRIPAQSWATGPFHNMSTSMTGSVSSPCEQDLRREREQDSNEYSQSRQFGNDAMYARLSCAEQYGPPQGMYNPAKPGEMASSLSPNPTRMTSGTHDVKSPYSYSGYPNSEYYPDRVLPPPLPGHVQPYYPRSDISQRYNPNIFTQSGETKPPVTLADNSPAPGITNSPSKRHAAAHSPYYESATMTVSSSQSDSNSYQAPYFQQHDEIRTGNLPTAHAPYTIRSPNQESPTVDLNISTRE